MHMRRFAIVLYCLALAVVLGMAPQPAYAQQPDPAEAEETEYLGSPNATVIMEGEKKYIYEQPTRQEFSKLYWALGMMDPAVDENVDNFIQINECGIYKDYFFNEFEWKSVRQSARNTIKERTKTFPLRFEIMQPLFLGEYDLQHQRFDVQEEYQIKNTARIEVFPSDYDKAICIDDGTNRIQQIAGYPLGIIAELNRPLNVTTVPIPTELAKAYIDEKMANFKRLRAEKQTQNNIYIFRDAYIFLHVKFFAYRGQAVNRENYNMASIMAVLEGFEVYADKDKKLLLWSQDYRKKKARSVKRASELKKLNEPEKIENDDSGKPDVGGKEDLPETEGQ